MKVKQIVILSFEVIDDPGEGLNHGLHSFKFMLAEASELLNIR
jgi:hypothetical protein